MSNQAQQPTLLEKLTKLLKLESIKQYNNKYIIEKELMVSDVKKLDLSDEEMKLITFTHVRLTKDDVKKYIRIDQNGNCQVPTYVTHIGGREFENNQNLISIKLPKSNITSCLKKRNSPNNNNNNITQPTTKGKDSKTVEDPIIIDD